MSHFLLACYVGLSKRLVTLLTLNGPEMDQKDAQSASKVRPKTAQRTLIEKLDNSWVLNTEINPKAAETLCMLWPLKNAALGQVRKNISKHESNHKSLLRVLIATANIPSSVQEFFSYPSFLQFWWIMFCTPWRDRNNSVKLFKLRMKSRKLLS